MKKSIFNFAFSLLTIICGISACSDKEIESELTEKNIDLFSKTISENEEENKKEELSKQVLNNNYPFDKDDDCYIYQSDEDIKYCMKTNRIDTADNKTYLVLKSDTQNNKYANAYNCHACQGVVIMFVIKEDNENGYQIISQREENIGSYGGDAIQTIDFLQFGQHIYGWNIVQENAHMGNFSIYTELFAHHDNNIIPVGHLYASGETDDEYPDNLRLDIKPQTNNQGEFAPLNVSVSGKNVKNMEYVVPFNKNKKEYAFDMSLIIDDSDVNFKKGDEAFQNRDYTQAAQLFEKSCNGGAVQGCHALGFLYLNGKGVPQNYSKAAELFEQACNGGIAKGCNNLGLLYRKGQGVQQDNVQAAQLWEKACNGGSISGCVSLGSSYAEGKGVKQNYSQAVKLFEKACNNNVTEGCFDIGLLYYNGQGVKKDHTQAAKLFEKACNGGAAPGCFNLGMLYGNGQGVKKNLSTAKKYFGKACDLGEKQACSVYKKL
ncbi:MAG: sel1 repeat family protein [Neisseriaceae bacterium]|nr:sel1 repeat family protein [Neisseriaceae bacterium]